MVSTHLLLLVLFELSFGSEGWFGLKLGPDSGDIATCTTDECYPGTQGFTRPRSLKGDTCNEEAHEKVDSNTKGEFALVEKDENESMLSVVSSSVSGAFSTASEYFKRTVYNKAENMTSDFTEKIREVFHEELYGFFEVMTKKLGDLLFSPDTSLGIVLQAFGHTTLTVSLVLLCLLLNYILLWFVSVLSILAFDCTIFLLHHFMGPQWIFSQAFWACGYVYEFLKLMVLHPYITSALIVLLFFLGIVIPIIKWTVRRSDVQKVDSIELCVTDISHRLDPAFTDLKQRLQRVEENQKELLTLLKSMQQTHSHRD